MDKYRARKDFTKRLVARTLSASLREVKEQPLQRKQLEGHCGQEGVQEYVRYPNGNGES